MPRNRIIYQSEGLFVGPTGALPSGASLTGIQRVQSVNHTETINRTNVLQFGRLSQLDRIITQAPNVTLNFESYLVNAINAKRLGFLTDGSANTVGNILSGYTDSQNYYIGLAPDGTDLVGTTGAGAFGFGNGFITNATWQGAVGDLAKENYTIEALNYHVYDISSGNVPTINPLTGLELTGINFVLPVATTGTATSVAAIKHGDITATITDTLGFLTSNLHIQSFNITAPLAREDILQLGTQFPFAKVITFPVTVTAQFTCIAGDIASGSLANKICTDNAVNLTVILREPNCQGTGNIAVQFTVLQAKLDSTNYSSAIGSNATVEFNYSTLLGAPNDSAVGLLISGISA